MNKTVEVSQGDIDAANEFWAVMAKRIMAGIGGSWPEETDGPIEENVLVQAFARHRLATIRTTPSTDAVREAVGREEGLIGPIEAATDLLALYDADQRTVAYRSDRWECLRAALSALQLADTRTTQPDSALREALEAQRPIAVCSNRRRASTQSGRGNQWWARDVWHIKGETNRTLCGRDTSDWLTIGEVEAVDANCCTRCAALQKDHPHG
jgi:hypothetical protein